VVKRAALLALGLWVVFGATGHSATDFSRVQAALDGEDTFGARWIALLFLAGTAVICLPRQFQVTVVENSSEQQLRTASWLFPLYLFLICLFVIPIAQAGLNQLPAGSNPDLFVLTLPLQAGQDLIGMLAILGGFSSATSMVIVSSIALSTMISNHIIMPLRLAIAPASGGQSLRRFILGTRRASIVFTILLGLLYFRLSGNSDALAAIGLVSFCGVAQFLPSLVAGLYWRRATHRGAIAGLAAGFVVWGYALFLPSFDSMPASVIEDGLFGWGWLRPHALFGLSGLDPLVHAVFWSMFVNAGLLITVSLLSEPTPLTRLQSSLFVDVFRRQTENELRVIRRTARIKDLRQIADRILGSAEAVKLIRLDRDGSSATASDELIHLVEQRLAANVGAASARSLVSQVIVSETISVEELKRLANEADQIRTYSAELESKSRQLEQTANELAEANRRLRQIDMQKDEFLSQVSHEVRTPMTSIRSFSEILLSNPDIEEADRRRFIGIIQNESIRLTRLLDGILDLNLLEAGEPGWEIEQFDPETALNQALESCEALARAAGVRLERAGRARNARIRGNKEKLAQVFINLISNAIKYNTSDNPRVTISSAFHKGVYEAHVIDNGPGIAEAERERIFLKFARGAMPRQPGAGLGLAISRQIVERLGGSLFLRQASGSGCDFVVRLHPAVKA
jgi:signal transduction histidine kinase